VNCGGREIDMIDRTIYTVGDGDGQTTTASEQTSMWVAMQDLPRSAAHPFYARLNQILDQHDSMGTSRRSASDSMRTKGAPGCRQAATFGGC